MKLQKSVPGFAAAIAVSLILAGCAAAPERRAGGSSPTVAAQDPEPPPTVAEEPANEPTNTVTFSGAVGSEGNNQNYNLGSIVGEGGENETTGVVALGTIGGLSGDGATIGTISPNAPIPGRGVALPVQYEIVSNLLMPTQSYLPGNDGMPSGVVLLDQRASAQNAALCDALLGRDTATVQTERAARIGDPNADYLVTHWLLRGAVADEQDCTPLLAGYDYERANRIKRTYALSSSRGPVFLALDPTGSIVFLDLEDASTDQIFEATSGWMALALTAPQSGPNAGKPPQARGLAAGATRVFAKLAGGLASFVGGSQPTVVRFNDPRTGTEREFQLYRAGAYLIGATFLL